VSAWLIVEELVTMAAAILARGLKRPWVALPLMNTAQDTPNAISTPRGPVDATTVATMALGIGMLKRRLEHRATTTASVT